MSIDSSLIELSMSLAVRFSSHVVSLVLFPGQVSGDFDFDLGPDVDEPVDIEQRRWREMSPERFLPGGADAGARRLIFAAAGQIPGQAHDMLRSGPGLAKQLDDPLQRGSYLGGHVGRIVALLVAAGLARQHDPFAGTVNFDAVREAAGL